MLHERNVWDHDPLLVTETKRLVCYELGFPMEAALVIMEFNVCNISIQYFEFGYCTYSFRLY